MNQEEENEVLRRAQEIRQSRTRHIPVVIKITPAEKVTLLEAAGSAGLNMSDYIRKQCGL